MENQLLQHLPADIEGFVYKRSKYIPICIRYFARVVSRRLLLYKVGWKDTLGKIIIIDLLRTTVQVSTKQRSAKGTTFSLLTPNGPIYLVIPESSKSKDLWLSYLQPKPIPSISLSDFRVVRRLGASANCEVSLVEKLPEHLFYAMKAIPKIRGGVGWITNAESFCDKLEHHRYRVLQERTVLQSLHHPYIIKLYYAFQDEYKWYLVQEYCPGGDLFDALNAQPHHCFREDIICIWMAQLVSALEYLHDNDCVHRDIKLENILLDQEGHVRLCDFGFTKRLRSMLKPYVSRKKTHSFCGTKYYIAPEMIKGDHGHDHAVDWWSLGVLMYELCFGKSPWVHKDRNKLYHMIVNDDLKFPHRGVLSREALQFINDLLVKDPRHRLGYRVGPTVSQTVPGRSISAKTQSEIRQHPFFANINWDQIENKTVKVNTSRTQGFPDSVTEIDETRKRKSPKRDTFRFTAFSYVAPECDATQVVHFNSEEEEKAELNQKQLVKSQSHPNLSRLLGQHHKKDSYNGPEPLQDDNVSRQSREHHGSEPLQDSRNGSSSRETREFLQDSCNGSCKGFYFSCK